MGRKRLTLQLFLFSHYSLILRPKDIRYYTAYTRRYVCTQYTHVNVLIRSLNVKYYLKSLFVIFYLLKHILIPSEIYNTVCYFRAGLYNAKMLIKLPKS